MMAMYIRDFFVRSFFIIFSKKKIKKISGVFSIVFTHNMGGGTEKYLKGQLKKEVNDCLFITNYPLIIDFYVIKYEGRKYLYTLARLKKILLGLQTSEIIINSLVFFRKRQEILNIIKDLKSKNDCKLTVLFHDFYPVCPNYTLFCNGKNCTEYCSKEEILDYKKSWSKIFDCADELRTFSNSSREILLGFIPEYSQKITVIPHSVEYLKNITPVQYSSIPPLKVGIVGFINSEIKGSEILRRLSDNLDLYIVGGTSIRKKGINKLGRYSSIEALKELIEKNKITVILFSSVCAETFSYVISEIMALGLPVVCFSVGAQQEKIEKYEKGVICQSFDTNDIISAINKAYSFYSLESSSMSVVDVKK